MSFEVLNTLGTLTTAAIVGATAIAALVQLRHLRAPNQINAMLSVVSALDAKSVRDAATLARQKLAGAIEDPSYCELVVARARGKHSARTSSRDKIEPEGSKPAAPSRHEAGALGIQSRTATQV